MRTEGTSPNMKECKIPKIIHYCWFGSKQIPELETKCMNTWKKVLPDYEFMLWNEETFDVNSTEWTRTAYELKKYAFVSDYVRLWALQKFGGIYMDTDVKVIKSFDPLLSDEAFLCFEDVAGSIIASCVIGATRNHPNIQQLISYYDRSFDMKVIEDNEANVIALTDNLKKHGLELNGKEQVLEHAHIYPRPYFCPMDFWGNWDKTDNTYCVHMFSGSWLPNEKLKQHKKRQKWYFRIAKAIFGKIKNISILSKIRSRNRGKDQ